MDGRFFCIPRSSHRPAYYYSVPVQWQTLVKSPKVVSITIQIAESEPTRTRSRSEWAEKIQAALRGFMVTKYVRKIGRVRREVEEIERRAGEKETVELMRSDERERLKVNEALMSLLFRLDSVGGVDAGAREFRKKVIKKAIALQEKVDAIDVAADSADRKEEGADEEQFIVLSDGEEGGSTVGLSEEPVLDLPDQKRWKEVLRLTRARYKLLMWLIRRKDAARLRVRIVTLIRQIWKTGLRLSKSRIKSATVRVEDYDAKLLTNLLNQG